MPQYRYTARNERGLALRGVVTAPSLEALADDLRHKGYLVTKAREVAEGSVLPTLLRRWRSVSYDDLVLFNVQLSQMIRVGIPLLTALETLSRQTEHPYLKEILAEVMRSVEGGRSFSEALAAHPAVFSSFFISMVRAGEASGKLDEILRRLAGYAKHQAELRQQLQTALTYPLLLLVFGAAVIAFLIVGIIPRFVHLFLEAGVSLPLPTAFLFQLSLLARQYGVLLAAVVIGWGIGLRWYLGTEDGRRRRDALLLRLPLVGELVRQAAFSRLARTLETLFSSGVAVLESLAIAERTCGNALIGDVCKAAQAHVAQGGALSARFEASQHVPPMMVQMMKVGESSGTLEQMLSEIAQHYDERLHHGLKRLMTFIEPVFLLVVGGMVALIMASVLLPLFRMVHVIR